MVEKNQSKKGKKEKKDKDGMVETNNIKWDIRFKPKYISRYI